MEQTHYTLLGVESNASDDELREAYLRIARDSLQIEDPREFVGRFHEINTAFDVLFIDDTQAEYDDELQRAAESEIPVERDAEAEAESRLTVGGCSAYLVELGEVNVIGEIMSTSGKAIKDYREVRFRVYDEQGKLIGTDYTNWGAFGRHQAFDETIYYKPKKAKPARIVVIPS